MPKRFDNLLTSLATAVVLAGIVLYLRPETGASKQASVHAVEIVLHAQQMIEESDITSAVQAFDRETAFNAQGVYLFVLDAVGQNIYHAADHSLIGTDFAKLKDSDGRPFGQNLIRNTTASGAWHSYRSGNDWRLTYARKTPRGYIIAAGYNAPH